MQYNFVEFSDKLEATADWLCKEYSSIRTGRALPALLDSVVVESYGARMTLNQIASVIIEDARTLRVSPWDAEQIKGIEKGIQDANLGISVATDSAGVRVIFPELTEERRKTIIKLAKERHEHARINVRSARDEVWSDIQEQCRNGAIPEDEKFKLKDQMEKIVKDTNDKLEDMFKKKEAEILTQ